MSVTLYASVRPAADSSDAEAGSATRELCGSGDTYADAKAALDAQVPAGWQRLGYSRWPGVGGER